MASTTRISPTAHYTSYIWYRNGLSKAALATSWGRAFFWALQPLNAISSLALGGLTLEAVLMRRHLIIDHLLVRAIERGEVRQVLEIGSGLSPRGARLAEQPIGSGVSYVEGDLAPIASRKRRLLRREGADPSNHHVVALDALRDHGPASLAAVAAEHLRADTKTAVVTEGLVNYFDEQAIVKMWTRIADQLRQLGGGVYLSDIHLSSDLSQSAMVRAFRRGLELFVRGAVHLHFDDGDDVLGALRTAGFDSVRLHSSRDFDAELALPKMRYPDVVHIIEAVCRGVGVPS